MEEINEKNKDLIENRIPFGLLDAETKDRMSNWRYGYEVWQGAKGSDIWCDFYQYWPPGHKEVFRAKPAPLRRECFVNVYPDNAYVYEDLTVAMEASCSVDLLSRWKITSGEDGSNPAIEVIFEGD